MSAGVLTLVVGALRLGRRVARDARACSCELTVLSAATGGVFAAMILGHWYLVTPKLPEAPLLLLSRALLAVVCVQLVLFVAWVGSGAGPAGGAPFGALTGDLRAVRLAAPDRRARVPADRLLGGRQDGPDSLDGVRDRPPVHQRRHDRGRHDPRGRPVLRLRPARLTESPMKDDRDWIPDATDLDWIEAISAPAAGGARSPIEAAAEPLGVPIVDRHSGRVLVGAGRRTGGGSSRSGRPTATRRCGWPSASRRTARS